MGLAAVEYGDDVGVAQGRGQVGFADEPDAELVVEGQFCGEHFEGVAAGQGGVARQVDGAHAPGAEKAFNDVARDYGSRG